MGTCYYVVENVCKCCNRYDKSYHIGKSSWGWAFTFQGYKYDGLVSWQSWKEYLIRTNAHIRDEYGEDVAIDVFIDMIETYKSPNGVTTNPVSGEQRKNVTHNDEGRKKGWFNPEYDWDDEDGYSFCSREFS